MFWWTCLPEHHSQHPKNLKWANRARFKAARIAFMCSALITTVLKRCGVSQPRIHTCIWLERDSAHQTLNHDSHIFAISLHHMGATVLSKDEKEQRIYIVLLIEVPLYGKKYIFCFFTYTHKQKKHVRTHTHAVTATANRFATLSLLNADDAWVDGLLVAWFTEKGPLNECIFTSCRTMSDREVNN